MDYMKLSDATFFKQILSFNKSKSMNRDKLDFLRANPDVFERFTNMVDSGYASGFDLNSARMFLNYYDSYDFLLKVLKVIDNPLDYSSDERKKLFSLFNPENRMTTAITCFSDDERWLLNYISMSYFMCQSKNLKYEYVIKLDKNYNKALSLVKKVLKLYSKYGDCNKVYSFLYDNVKINHFSLEKMVDYLKTFFYKELCFESNGINKDLLSAFNYNDFIILERIIGKYYHLFSKFLPVVGVDNSVADSQYVKLFDLFDKINDFLSKNDNLEYCVDYVSNNLKITLDDIENDYQLAFRNYCFLGLYGGDCSSIVKSREINYLDVSNFYNMMIFYRELVHHTNTVIDFLCSNRSDMDKLIDCLYEIKFFNGVAPSYNQDVLLPKTRVMKNISNKKKCMDFISGYKNYYFSRKRELEEEALRLKNEYEFKNLELYARYVNDFINSGCSSINEFVSSSDIDRETFDEFLKVLKKHNHPVYELYIEYIEHIKGTNYAIIVSNARKVVDLITSGVEMADGTKRDFDIVDFYANSNLDKQKFLDVIKKNVPNNVYIKVSRFFARYRSDREIGRNGIEQLYDTKVSFASEFDSSGNIVSYYTVTKEDKQNTILKLKEMGVPLTVSTYNIMLKRCVDESLKKINHGKNLTK